LGVALSFNLGAGIQSIEARDEQKNRGLSPAPDRDYL
jgi:hypothetical protein